MERGARGRVLRRSVVPQRAVSTCRRRCSNHLLRGGAIISGLNHGGFSYYFQVRANNARALRIGPNIFICPVHRSIHRATRITLTLSAVEAATRLAVNGTQVASQNAMVALPDLGGDSELYDIDGPASRRLRRLIVQSRDRP